jgi:hypothetical protein
MENINVKTSEVKIPKKRGRKPTGKIFQIEKGNVKNIETDNECIIAFLPLNLADTKDIHANSEIIVEKSAPIKSNISIINDLKTIMTHTSEGSMEQQDTEKIQIKKSDDDNINKLKSKIMELEKLLYDNVKFDKLNEICIDITKGNVENVHCWWCCHDFDHQPIGIPDNYREEIFSTYGYFCSFNCAKAYNLDYIENKTSEKNCLIMMLKKKLTGEDSFIKPASPRQTLIMFGGHQTIDEFRKDFKMVDKTSLLIFPPLKPLKLYIEDEYKHKIVRFQNDYKIKRSKPLTRTSNSLANMLKIKE